MNSLRGRLTLIVAGLALFAVAAVTVIVAITTNDALEETLADQREAREAIVAELTEETLAVAGWAQTQPLVDELATEFGARIVLADIEGRRLVDSGEGELPPLEGVLDPFGPLAEFTGEAPFDVDEFNETLVACFEETGIEYRIDEFGDVFVIDDDPFEDAIDDCYFEAITILESEFVDAKEPALLFIGFETTPTIPWLLIAGIAAIVVTMAALAAAPLSALVTRSLRSLTVAVRSIRDGNLDVRVDATSPTEVAELADSFNDMSEELARADVRRRQLTADVAHELRSPLTNILGHLDAIEDGVIEPTADEVKVITSEAVRLAHLVEDLQTLAALDEETLSLDLAPADMDEVVDTAIAARRSRAREQEITLAREGSSGGEAAIDRTRFDQILGNVLDNALEHTPTGGTVTVEVVDSDNAVHVTVADTGPGIDPAALPYVFDRLSRADPSRSPGNGGRGLGLAIARALARAHGGDVTAANNDTRGARFTITIRRHSD